MSFRINLAIIILILAGRTMALGPHEVLVLANSRSERSLELARTYMSLRHIPSINLVELNVPTNSLEISPDEFTRQIIAQASSITRERGLSNHILAWVYSLDFPIRITTSPPVSIQGFTFLRGHIPDHDSIKYGTYASPLFAGPDHPKVQGFPSQSLDVQKAWMESDMPLPSMSLGFAGERGNTVEEIIASLKRGGLSDGTCPDGSIYFVTNTDIRSTCRQWEFSAAVNELRTLGITASITNSIPYTASNVLGIICGTSDVDPSTISFAPGAMAENLTSFGAAFDINGQTKVSTWIRSGASATAGTVTEPFSYWTKFTHARFFAHLTAGCTTIEAFFQSLRCPLQILLVGDPLAAPWASSASITVKGLTPNPLRGNQEVIVSIESPPDETFGQFLFLLDGIPMSPLGRKPSTLINCASIPAGNHTFRAIAYRIGSTRSQIFTEVRFSSIRQ